MTNESFTYKDAGVDVAAGNAAVQLLKERLRSTKHPLVLEGIGGFGGIMRLPPLKDGVLVASTDGVGTKLLLAQQLGQFSTVGIDLVAMSVNDVSATGAVPLFFLDYLVVGKLDPERVAELVGGVDEGCLRAQCVLLGGETAEHPGHFKAEADFDMAGFAVGIAERGELWGPSKVRQGDALIAIASTGVHANGFSLVRKLLAERRVDVTAPFPAQPSPSAPAGTSIGEVLLTPTAIYSPALHNLGHACPVHAAAHITGGGFPDNLTRALPDDLAAVVDLSTWELPGVFAWLRELGAADDDLLNTFNCGVGMIVVLPAEETPKALSVITQAGHAAWIVGTVVARQGGAAVRYSGSLW
jgi:phosphoribosylformylglycinamidine cyclo-ligase